MPSTGRAAVIAGWDLDGPAPRHPTKLCTDHRAELLDGSKKDGLRWSAGSLPVLSAAHSHLELINLLTVNETSSHSAPHGTVPGPLHPPVAEVGCREQVQTRSPAQGFGLITACAVLLANSILH
jgi:hypothetical protein